MPKWQGYSWEIKHDFYPWILQLKQVRASLDFPSLNKTKTGQNFCDFNKGLNTLSDFKRSQYSNTSALKWQEKRATSTLLWWCLPCVVSGTGLPAHRSPTAGASTCPAKHWFGWWTFVLRPTCTVLASSVAICWAGRSYTHAAAWGRKWLCGQQDPCLSHRPCAESTALAKEVWKRWLWTMWRHSEKSSRVCCQHT